MGGAALLKKETIRLVAVIRCFFTDRDSGKENCYPCCVADRYNCWQAFSVQERSIYFSGNQPSQTVDLHLTFQEPTYCVLTDFSLDNHTAKNLIIRFYNIANADIERMTHFMSSLFGSKYLVCAFFLYEGLEVEMFAGDDDDTISQR